MSYLGSLRLGPFVEFRIIMDLPDNERPSFFGVIPYKDLDYAVNSVLKRELSRFISFLNK